MDWVAIARSLAPLAAIHAEAADRDARLDHRVVDAMAEAGLYRLAVAADVGGIEADPMTTISVIEAISRGDGAAGWNLMIGNEIAGLASSALPLETTRAIYTTNAHTVMSGGVRAVGRAELVDDGSSVSRCSIHGRWPFASGCQQSEWFWAGCQVFEHGNPKMRSDGSAVSLQALVPQSDIEIVETWDVTGMRGSGSHDVVIDHVVVDEDRTSDLLHAPPLIDSSLFRAPMHSRLAWNKVGVATGIARSALDAFTDLATTKRPIAATAILRERAAAQLAIAEAEARWRSARAFVFDAVGVMWETLERGDAPDLRSRAMVRLACSRVCEEAAAVVEIVCTQAGTSANQRGSTLERARRDVAVVRQHTTVSPAVYEDIGRVLLGLDPIGMVF